MRLLGLRSRVVGVATGNGVCAVALLILCLGATARWADAGDVGAVGDLYVTSDTHGTVIQFDGTTGALVGTFASGVGLDGASGLVFTPNGNLLVSGYRSNNVVEYDGTTGAFIRVFASGGLFCEPHGLALGPNGNLFVANWGGGHVLEYDGTTGAFIDVFANARPHGVPDGYCVETLVFGPNGNLFVAAVGNFGVFHNVLEFDGSTGAYVRHFTAGNELRYPDGLAFRPNGNLLVGSHFSSEIFEYDGTTGALIRLFATVSRPAGIVLGPNGNLFVAVDFSDTVEQFDVNSGAFINVFANGPGLLTRPWYLVFKPSPDPVVLILELVDDVESLNVQQGIANSLDAKLDAVLQALEDVNQNNDVAAINALEAFINAVQAQSGNHIPQPDAEALIAKAQEIINLLLAGF